MLVQRNIERVEGGWRGAGEYAELLKSIPEYGPAPPHKWRVYVSASFSPWDEVVFEVEWESMAEREAWWQSWSVERATPRQREWYDKRSELVISGRAELWNVDGFG